jgi:hypothetical protein
VAVAPFFDFSWMLLDQDYTVCNQSSSLSVSQSSHLPVSPSPPMLFTSKFTIANHQVPLAVYREIAAHLRQIEGITVSFLTSVDRGFSYTESQLGGLEIMGANLLTDSDRIRLERLLNYYADRYNQWEIQGDLTIVDS